MKNGYAIIKRVYNATDCADFFVGVWGSLIKAYETSKRLQNKHGGKDTEFFTVPAADLTLYNLENRPAWLN